MSVFIVFTVFKNQMPSGIPPSVYSGVKLILLITKTKHFFSNIKYFSFILYFV